jgi:hypothetical protein
MATVHKVKKEWIKWFVDDINDGFYTREGNLWHVLNTKGIMYNVKNVAQEEGESISLEEREILKEIGELGSRLNKQLDSYYEKVDNLLRKLNKK